MKVWVWRRCSFDAAHTLPLHPGVCSRLHGHTYTVEFGLESVVDAQTGMGIDLNDLKIFLYQQVVAEFDHRNLNDVIQGQPTAEVIAEVILDAATARWSRRPMTVRVFESPDSWVEVKRW